MYDSFELSEEEEDVPEARRQRLMARDALPEDEDIVCLNDFFQRSIDFY